MHGLANNLSSVIEGNLYDLRVSEIVFFLFALEEVKRKQDRIQSVGWLETHEPTDQQTNKRADQHTDAHTDRQTRRPTDYLKYSYIDFHRELLV